MKKLLTLGIFGLFCVSNFGAVPEKIFAEEIFAENCEQLENSSYKICTGENSGVFYEGTKIEEADVESFEVLNRIYAKDKNNVYQFRKKIENADPQTFEYLEDWYTKDKNTVYYEGKIIQNADPKTFKVIGSSGYAKDKNNVYVVGKKIENLGF